MAIIAPVVDGKVQSKINETTKKTENLGGSNMGYDEFLNLLCAEMQYQDPLEPTTNTDYVAQMATFSQLEATLSMKDTITESDSVSESTVANALVGKSVSVKDSKSSTGYTTGKVDYVMYKDGEVYLSIGERLFNISDLESVADDTYYDAIVQAKTINSMINELPKLEELTVSYKTAIQQIRDVYNGLNSYQQSFVSKDDLDTLKRYESKIEQLEEEQNNAGTDSGNDTNTDNTTDTDNTTNTDNNTGTDSNTGTETEV